MRGRSVGVTFGTLWRMRKPAGGRGEKALRSDPHLRRPGILSEMPLFLPQQQQTIPATVKVQKARMDGEPCLSYDLLSRPSCSSMEVAHLIRIKICISDSMPRTAFPISHRGAMGSQPREFVIRFLLALRESTAMEGSKALSLSLSLSLSMLRPSDSAQL